MVAPNSLRIVEHVRHALYMDGPWRLHGNSYQTMERHHIGLMDAVILERISPCTSLNVWAKLRQQSP